MTHSPAGEPGKYTGRRFRVVPSPEQNGTPNPGSSTFADGTCWAAFSTERTFSGAPVTAEHHGQVIDLPVVTSQVTEQRAQTWVCAGCGTATIAAFPDMMRAPWPVRSEARFHYGRGQKHEACHI